MTSVPDVMTESSGEEEDDQEERDDLEDQEERDDLEEREDRGDLDNREEELFTEKEKELTSKPKFNVTVSINLYKILYLISMCQGNFF